MTEFVHQRGVRDQQRELLALPPRKTRLNSKFSQGDFKVDIFKAEKTGNLRKLPEVGFLRRKSVPHRPAATREVANRKKTANSPKNEKPGSVGKSTLPGVEVAGFPFGPQPIWSRLHTVELASYRLRKDSMKFPPLAVIESFPHGLSKSTDSNPHHSG